MPCFAVAATDSMPMPCLPAARAPVGENDAATAMSKQGSLYGASCRRASRRMKPSVSMVTVSPRSSAMIASSDSSMRGRCASDGMPSMCASEVSWPGTDAEHRAPAGEVVEQHHPVGEHQRVVVRERAHAGAELDVLRALGRDADEDLG